MTVTFETIAEFHRAAMRTAERAASERPALYAGEDGGPGLGSAFIRSRTYKDWLERFPAGVPGVAGDYRSDPLHIEGGLRTLLTSDPASAGALSPNDYKGLLDSGLYRPVRLLSLLTHLPSTTDAVEIATEASHVAAAAPVAEASALTGTSGTKPEGGVTFSLTTHNVRTFAAWVPATKRIMSDAGELRTHIDLYLRSELERAVEDQVLTGDGTGQNFTGLLNAPGVQTQSPPGGGESMFDVIRKARTLVELNGRTAPNAVVLHPTDSQTIDLLKKNSEANNFVANPYANAQPPLWGMARVVTDAMPQGSALVGDFSRAILFDRESTTISVGTVADDFIRNILRVLGESRAAFGVVRPKAFAIVDLVA